MEIQSPGRWIPVRWCLSMSKPWRRNSKRICVRSTWGISCPAQSPPGQDGGNIHTVADDFALELQDLEKQDIRVAFRCCRPWGARRATTFPDSTTLKAFVWPLVLSPVVDCVDIQRIAFGLAVFSFLFNPFYIFIWDVYKIIYYIYKPCMINCASAHKIVCTCMVPESHESASKTWLSFSMQCNWSGYRETQVLLPHTTP